MTTELAERTDKPIVTCAFCHEDITALYEWRRSGTGWVGVGPGGAETHWTPDYFADGATHLPEDFPVPPPYTSHGNRATQNGTVVHACGTWAAA